MQGGQYQHAWFKNIPERRDDQLFYLAQFMAFIMLGGCVIPTIIQPNSILLCYQMAVIHGINILHTFIFLCPCSSAYMEARPKNDNSYAQWGFMTVVSIAFFIITIVACLNDSVSVIDPRSTLVSKTIANIVMLAFSSVFGIMFIIIPKYILSAFWSDNTLQGNPKMCGFNIFTPTAHQYWWSRCMGVAILGLNIGLGISRNLEHPLYTLSSLIIVSCLTLFNIHQVTMRPYRSISDLQIRMSWIPNIVMSLGVVAVMICAHVQTA